MKVKLKEIPGEGLTLIESFDPAVLDLQTPGVEFIAPIQVTAVFYKERSTVWVKVAARGSLRLVCGRCLTDYTHGYAGRFDLSYEVEGRLALDVTDDIRQEILLDYPVRFLCKESCLGLCPQCGKNLNEGSCTHAITEA